MRLLSICLLISVCASAQTDLIYPNLPVGKYDVGFKIFTITDPSRISKPQFNYLGEKIDGDRRRKITIHLWYPAQTSTTGSALTYTDYCYSSLLTSTNEKVPSDQKEAEANRARRAVENWWGKTSDEAWLKLMGTKMIYAQRTILRRRGYL